MFEIKRYSDADKEVWNAYVEQARNATFLFNRNYMDYHRDRFKDYSLMVYKNQKLYAILPGNQKESTFYSHQGLTYGGLLTTKKATAEDICEVFSSMNSYLKENGFKKVVYKPIPWIYSQLPAEEDLYALFKECHAQIIARNISAVIHLQHPLQWYNIRKSGAKKAIAAGLKAELCENDEDFHSFWNILSTNLMNTYGAKPVHTLEEIDKLRHRFPQNIRLYIEREADVIQEDGSTIKGKILGGTLLYISPHVVHTQYISASEEGKQKHALDALFLYLTKQEYKDYEYFDFGTSNENRGKYLNTSLIYQKEGFGGRGVVYDTYEWEL